MLETADYVDKLETAEEIMARKENDFIKQSTGRSMKWWKTQYYDSRVFDEYDMSVEAFEEALLFIMSLNNTKWVD